MDRYNHDLAGEDTDDTEDMPSFGSFSSYTPQYRKQHYSWSRAATTTSSELSSSANSTPPTAVVTTTTTTTVQHQQTKVMETSNVAIVTTSAPITSPTSVDVVVKPKANVLSPSSGTAMANKLLNTPQLRKIGVGFEPFTLHCLN